MDGATQLDVLLPAIGVVVDGISPEQLGNPTACSGYDVAGVLEHMIGGVAVFAPAFRGEPATPNPRSAAAGDVFARWGAAMADLQDAVRSPGADGRIIAAPLGQVPGAVFARFIAFDGLVHGWDLATATGQPYAPNEAVVAEVDAFARQALTPDMRDGDTFAAETPAPPDAGVLERLVAFSGRQLTNREEAR